MNILIIGLLEQIRQGYLLKKHDVYIYKFNNVCLTILDLLYTEGFIMNYQFKASQHCIIVVLKYINGRCAMSQLEIYSRTLTVNIKMLKQLLVLKNRFGVFGVLTSKGFVSDKHALLVGEGGQILFYIE